MIGMVGIRIPVFCVERRLYIPALDSPAAIFFRILRWFIGIEIQAEQQQTGYTGFCECTNLWGHGIILWE